MSHYPYLIFIARHRVNLDLPSTILGRYSRYACFVGPSLLALATFVFLFAMPYLRVFSVHAPLSSIGNSRTYLLLRNAPVHLTCAHKHIPTHTRSRSPSCLPRRHLLCCLYPYVTTRTRYFFTLSTHRFAISPSSPSAFVRAGLVAMGTPKLAENHGAACFWHMLVSNASIFDCCEDRASTSSAYGE